MCAETMTARCSYLVSQMFSKQCIVYYTIVLQPVQYKLTGKTKGPTAADPLLG
jgi:hypothetical protein